MDMTGARWRKSSFSTGNGGGDDNCVEVAAAPSAMAVRDSKNAVGPALVLPMPAFRALVAETRKG